MRELLPEDLIAIGAGMALALVVGVAIVGWSVIAPWLLARRSFVVPALLIVVATSVGAAVGHPGAGLLAGVIMAGVALWPVKPSAQDGASYDEPPEDEDDHHDAEFDPFEPAEPHQNVQRSNDPNDPALSHEDVIKIDTAARALARGWAGEAALIEEFWPGVKRGGSKRYTTLRDAVHKVAREAHGWQGREPERVTPLAQRPVARGVQFHDEQRALAATLASDDDLEAHPAP